DYIYLNKGRTLSDTSYPDRTISSSLTSPFSGYWAIPVRHYFVNPGAQVGTPSFEIYNLRVGNNQPLNYFSYSEINQYKDGVESKSFHLLDSAEDVGGSLNGLERRNVALTTVPDVSFFNPTSDSIHVDIKVGLSTKDNVPPSGQGDYDPAIYNPIDFRHNDTIRATYSLSNYYAYDDGGAEYGAALNQSGSRVAYLFEMRTTDADTLIAVDIYFPKFGDESAQNILLQILSNLNDEPSSILHQQLVPVQRTGLNKFVRIPLLKTITIQSQFYIGWQQLSFAVIAVGLDKNSNSSDRIYFNTSNVWVQDVALAGSLMIRPVFGEGDGIISGLEDRTPDMGPYPNPTSDKFYLARDAKNISVYDFAGRAIDLFFSEEEDRIMIKLQNPSSGVYILRYLQNGKVKTSRLLVSPDQR
ncbi:MAG: T9SS type A sorting domain-containing protein, partial [Flammeovirgaceae bacterium]|nr:T9SS type A sorting domain-containing protein [Flammeovirgaceae bacterium]